MLEKIMNHEVSINDIDINNARDLFYYAYYNEDIDINYLSEHILKTKHEKYIKLFITHIKKVEKEYFLDYILNSESASYIYNVFFDINDYVEYADLFLKRLIELNNSRYLHMFLYYYFITLDLSDENVIKITQELINIKSLEELKNAIITGFNSDRENYKINSDGFSNKCYEGHNGVIPFIIVLHISTMYEKIIYNFYDDVSEVSSHFVIGRNGEYKQVLDLKNSSWANGTSLNQESDVYYKLSTNKFIKEMDMNANYFTYSIEHESLDGSLTEEQYKTTLSIIKKIIKYLKNEYNYDFIIDKEHIIGHKDVNPIVRTKCPGEKFPFERLIHDLNDLK